MGKVQGHSIKIGGSDFILPPLNLRLYYADDGETPRPEVEIVQNPKAHTQSQYNRAATTLLEASLRRNYDGAELPRDFLLDNVVVADLPKYVFAMLTNAGFKKPDPLDSKTEIPEGSGPAPT